MNRRRVSWLLLLVSGLSAIAACSLSPRANPPLGGPIPPVVALAPIVVEEGEPHGPPLVAPAEGKQEESDAAATALPFDRPDPTGGSNTIFDASHFVRAVLGSTVLLAARMGPALPQGAGLLAASCAQRSSSF